MNTTYTEIENKIIKWVCDENQTAGTLTRSIFDVLEKTNFNEVYETYKGKPNLTDFLDWLNENYYPVKK